MVTMNSNLNRKKLFGTNGIRGIPNKDLSMRFCLDIGMAVGTFYDGTDVAIARDTRMTGPAVLDAVTSGLLSTGCNVIDLGILPTPALQFHCKNKHVYGVMITASHNPPEFNGIKCIDRDGTEVSKETENEIEDLYYSGKSATVNWQNMGQADSYSVGIIDYVKGIAARINLDAIRKKKFRIAFDAGNGASYLSTPLLLSHLGCSVTSLNCNPDGKFSSRLSEPKEENLIALKEIMSSGSFDLGIAHDGDADRAVFFDEKGEFIDGDKSLALLVSSVLREGDTIVTPISSSDILEEISASKGARLIRTIVGAPVVSRAMIDEKARIGGEENGGVIFSDHQYCRDGAMTVALFLDLMARTESKASKLVADLPKYYLYRSSLRLERQWSDIREKFATLVESRNPDRRDGFKLSEKNGWVLVRPSGTEPIVRIYGHSSNEKDAKEIAEKYKLIIEGLEHSQ